MSSPGATVRTLSLFAAQYRRMVDPSDDLPTVLTELRVPDAFVAGIRSVLEARAAMSASPIRGTPTFIAVAPLEPQGYRVVTAIADRCGAPLEVEVGPQGWTFRFKGELVGTLTVDDGATWSVIVQDISPLGKLRAAIPPTIMELLDKVIADSTGSSAFLMASPMTPAQIQAVAAGLAYAFGGRADVGATGDIGVSDAKGEVRGYSGPGREWQIAIAGKGVGGFQERGVPTDGHTVT